MNAQRTLRLNWLHGLAVDAATFAVVMLVAIAALGQGYCTIDPRTGQRTCAEAQIYAAPQAGAYGTWTAPQVAPLPWRCRIVDGNGYSGTGSLITDRHILTAAHVIRDSGGHVQCDFPNYALVPGRIVAADSDQDLALIEIPETGITPVAVSTSDPQGPLTAGGFHGVQFGASRGPIVGPADRWLRMQGVAAPGYSGGGVIDADGRLTGVLWGCRDNLIYFTCGRPLARFLDRWLPNRPGRIVPPASPPITTQPAATQPVMAPVQLVPPQPHAAEPPTISVPTLPPQIVAPAIPPLVPPAATQAPLWHPPTPPATSGSASSPSGPLDAAGRWGATWVLTALGFSAGGAALVAPIAWGLAKWRLRRRIDAAIARIGRPAMPVAATPPVAAQQPEGSATNAEQTFRFAEQTTSYEPIPRDATEGHQLLQLAKLEGRDPLLDSVAGRLVRTRIETLAESDADPQRRNWAKELMHELDREFNRIAPAKITV